MEKLIKLLNEYNKEKTNGEIGWREWKYDDEFGNLLYGNYNGGTFSEMYCISKRYGFIEWLVRENKIDTQNLITYMNGTSLTFNKVPSTDCVNIDKTWNNFYTECLLMLLAIQENPISFLINVLK